MRCAAGLTSWRVSCPPACPIGSRAHHFMSPFLLSDAQPASRPRSPHTSVQHTTGLRLEESEAEVKVSIVLADDHRVVREGLRMLLEVKGGATVVAKPAMSSALGARCASTTRTSLSLTSTCPANQGFRRFRAYAKNSLRQPLWS